MVQNNFKIFFTISIFSLHAGFALTKPLLTNPVLQGKVMTKEGVFKEMFTDLKYLHDQLCFFKPDIY